MLTQTQLEEIEEYVEYFGQKCINGCYEDYNGEKEFANAFLAFQYFTNDDVRYADSTAFRISGFLTGLNLIGQEPFNDVIEEILTNIKYKE